MSRWIAALALVAMAGCGAKKPPPNAGLDEMNAVLGSAGLKVEALLPADPSTCAAFRCLAGKIEGVDALECEYRDAAAAAASARRCEAWVGNAVTGLALDEGKVVLVLADRTHADPSGKIISKISHAFHGTK